MYPVARQMPTQTKVVNSMQSPSGVLTHIALNYDEMQCIELALIGLAEHLRNNDLPDSVADSSLNQLNAQLNYLSAWINQPALKAALRFDGLNSVWWPFTSSELVDWLINICRFCISEAAILIASADAASIEYAEFSETVLEDISRYSVSDDMNYRSFSAFQHYYHTIVMMNQEKLVRKLVLIQEQDYPLFPHYSANY